jgi:hypothetical protein
MLNVIEQAVADLSSSKNTKVVEEAGHLIADILLSPEENVHLNKTTIAVIGQVIDLLKEQVSIQHWKLKEEDEQSK